MDNKITFYALLALILSATVSYSNKIVLESKASEPLTVNYINYRLSDRVGEKSSVTLPAQGTKEIAIDGEKYGPKTTVFLQDDAGEHVLQKTQSAHSYGISKDSPYLYVSDQHNTKVTIEQCSVTKGSKRKSCKTTQEVIK